MIDKLKVLIVDDAVIYRRVLSAAVDGTGLAKTERTSPNGLIALERLKQQA